MDEISREPLLIVMLGVYSDEDARYRREPVVLMGTCYGLRHVPELIVDLREAMNARIGVRPAMDYFWSGRTEAARTDEAAADWA